MCFIGSAELNRGNAKASSLAREPRIRLCAFCAPRSLNGLKMAPKEAILRVGPQGFEP